MKRGETVATLSRRFGASADLIRQANRSARGKALVPGTMLYIPVTTTIPASFLREPDPPRTTRTVVRTYVVRAGESIAAVARRAGVSVAALRTENNLPPGARLRAGQRLVVRRTVTATNTTPHPACGIASGGCGSESERRTNGPLGGATPSCAPRPSRPWSSVLRHRCPAPARPTRTSVPCCTLRAPAAGCDRTARAGP